MTARLKLKKLEEYLQFVDSFEKPKILLEQYQTPSEIAANWIFSVQSNYNDIEGKLVGELGCGTGILSIAAALLGAEHTVGFDIDSEALNVARNNVNEMEISTVDFVKCDVLNDLAESKAIFDTVLMNPPFGTKKNAGIDMSFLNIAIQLSKHVVYSLHKTSTRDFIQKKTKELKVEGKVIAQLRYNIDKCYRFHKKSSVDIEVDVWRFSKIE
jgi:rRNA N6-adenosine-methyltransferase METTL5